ncbi:SOUL family heme-binding protein [Methanocrinis sp.]|uniref:SOUL family heme-binding protein n=1 Tax=Methanocrinis sp. TaxID=3101522 RepID=UPI003D0AA784
MIEISKIQMAAVAILAALLLWTLYGAFVSMSVKEPPYQVIETLENDVEIREYSNQIWAVTLAEDENQGFGRLFGYITGANEEEKKIEMTAPVVTWEEDGEMFMAFVMPEDFNLEGTPRPLDEKVKIELVKERRMAVIAFSGYATEDSRKRHLKILEETLEAQGIETIGDPVLMQYNDPWAPPFMRRNEVGLEVGL